MAIEQKPLRDYVLLWLDEGQGREQVEIMLLEKGHDEKFVKELVTEAIKLRQQKRMAQGLVFILGGALICLISCVLSIVVHMSHDTFTWVLYGLTTLGILVVFAGLMKIF